MASSNRDTRRAPPPPPQDPSPSPPPVPQQAPAPLSPPQQRRHRPASSNEPPAFLAAGAAVRERVRQLQESSRSLNPREQPEKEEYFSAGRHYKLRDGFSGIVGRPSYASEHGLMGFVRDSRPRGYTIGSNNAAPPHLNFSLGSLPFPIDLTVPEVQAPANPPHPSMETPLVSFLPSPAPPYRQEVEPETRPASPSAEFCGFDGAAEGPGVPVVRKTTNTPKLRRSRRSTLGRKRPRAEDFAPAATTAQRVLAHIRKTNREERNRKRAHKESGYDVEMMAGWDSVLDSNDVDVGGEDYYGHWYGRSERGAATVDGTEDTMDLDREETPAPPADPGFQVSERWKQRGPAGQAKARWASNRYQAKKRVKKTDRWLAASPEERLAIETEAADAVPFIPDAVPALPVPPRPLEPWLRSERETLLRLIDYQHRHPELGRSEEAITESYNRRVAGIRQRAGEYCVAVGNGQGRRDSQLAEDRIAPARTAISIRANLNKWVKEKNICDCREHQRYLVGDFDRSGDFPFGHGLEYCVLDRREDTCYCKWTDRDYNGKFPDTHGDKYCDSREPKSD